MVFIIAIISNQVIFCSEGLFTVFLLYIALNLFIIISIISTIIIIIIVIIIIIIIII